MSESPFTKTEPQLNIGLLGYGTVGRTVAELLDERDCGIRIRHILRRPGHADGLLMTDSFEAVLNDHPKVAESAVIGAPDKLRGEVVAAYVVPSDPSLTVEELKEYCTNSPVLSSYKWPRIYNIVDSLPHTATGKIMHRALRNKA